MLTGEPRGGAAVADCAEEDETWFRRWRARELDRVDQAGLAYLDYAGAALHPASLVTAETKRLDARVLGNPHSEHRASRAANEDLEAARRAILEFLSADPSEYGVVLTPNASGACRLVGEGYRWNDRAPLVLSADNHNSVNGIGEYARRAGAEIALVPLDEDLRMPAAEAVLARHAGSRGLFAFPAQSNFSGVRHSLGLVAEARRLGLAVLLDAAAFLPSSRLDLQAVKPDFVVLSLYKIAGYPAGVGALVARWDALAQLQRPWFAGGTVDWVSMGLGRHQLRSGVDRFEDGTPPFLVAGAVPAALAAVTAADRPRLARHLDSLTEQLLEGLSALRHPNGRRLVRLHGPQSTAERGATVAFTVETDSGEVVPYWEVEASAAENGVAFRGGCFCNPGCAERAFGLSPAVIGPCLDSLGDRFSIPLLAKCLGDGPVGAVRASLGLGSVTSDVDRAVALVAGYLTAQA